MSTPNARPRRSNANLHPADIILQDRRTRRSSAEVAQEKADLEAKRKALLDKRDAQLRELALLEQQLELEAEEETMQGMAPAHTPVSSSKKKQPAKPPYPKPLKATTPRPAVQAAGGGRGVVEDDATPKSKSAKGGLSGRVKRATRLDMEAYRQEVATHLKGAGHGPQSDSSVGPTPGRVPPAAGSGRAAAKRKVDVVEVEDNEHTSASPEVNRPKKGRLTKPGGVTVAAAAKFAQLPPTTTTSTTTFSAPSPPTVLAADAAVPSAQPPVAVQYGGYIPEDDPESNHPTSSGGGVGGEEAAQAVVKGSIKIELADPAVVTSTQAAAVPQTASAPACKRIASSVASGASAGHWSMAHIEQILGTFSGNFTASFVPKLINVTGNSASGPWKLYGFNLQGAMADIATEVWPDLGLEIIPRQPFFEVAKQKLSEYRNGVANEAIEVVGRYLLSRRFATTEARATYVAWALDEDLGFPFRYAQVWDDDEGILRKSGAYQSKLVIHTFTYHIRRINMRAEQIRDWPCNALALATTAVERALKMWGTGSLKRPRGHSEEAKFSDRHWGRAAGAYLNSITNLAEAQWNAILDKADLAMQGLDDDSASSSSDGDRDDTDNIATSGARGTIEDYAQMLFEEAQKITVEN
ncbi:hypothetical protein GY45DRAFT_1375605 [Cubamyces sp. BRFM 1775]|nr:hypothetical protein GY45DRAFT_1375605 [Cubamyces sp. BRFM 1775]